MWRLRICYCVFALLCCCMALVATAQTTLPSEVDALMAVRNNLKDPMKYLRNWKKGDPCTSSWAGVLCSSTNRTGGYLHVREIQLLNMSLSGQLAPELGQFSQLEILNFMWNDLTGNIPKEIGNISSLKLLMLNGNRLSGYLPYEIGYLSNLIVVQVDENFISGPIPKSFANLSKVSHFHMNNNSFSGEIPSELSQLPALIHMLLDNNKLSGTLPAELSNISQLAILQLDNNNFNGSKIPAAYGNLAQLVKLSLRTCNLNGPIPDLSNVSKLLYLDLSWNSLTGPLPSKLSSGMTTIDISYNLLSGFIPESFLHLPSLQRLSLENNDLTGPVPTGIWGRSISYKNDKLIIDLGNNKLSNITEELNPPNNVTLRLQGNPICSNASIPNIRDFCETAAGEDDCVKRSGNFPFRNVCPEEHSYECIPSLQPDCFCAAPLGIGYRLRSPSFSYFPPYINRFEKYITRFLHLDLYQLSIDSYFWEGSRLRMYLKLFPAKSDGHEFNHTEIQRIQDTFTSWNFDLDELFGSYDLLNFTMLGPYSQYNFDIHGINISKATLAAIILGAFACALATFAITRLVIARRYARYNGTLSRTQFSSKASIRIKNVRSFTFKEMVLATDNFNSSTQVGRGGYGKVYRGILADKMIVAIKRAEEGSLQGQKEFLTEIELLSRLHHRNLVSLVGYCDEEGEQMLVYEFMPNGTLRDWVSAKAKGTLNFNKRLSIALGSARGILYLHTEARPPVFHRDIKTTNILLDFKLNAKVADFGLSRLAPDLDEEGNVSNHVSTVVRGTPGYLDPEYFLTHKLTDKSDVYSLGIVFLELLTGMQPISHGKNIVREVVMAYKAGEILSIIDSRMGSYPSECVERFAGLALSCCKDNPEKRPPIMEVVRELENIHKMMPESGDHSMFSESSHPGSGESITSTSTYTYSENATFSSNIYCTSKDVPGSSSALQTHLDSGVVPVILPR